MAQIIEKGPKRFLVRAFLGRDPETGKRRYHCKTIRGTKTQAKELATKLQAQVDAGTLNEPAKQTVAEFFTYWLDNTAARKVKPYTLDDYRRLGERYIKPSLGHVKLGALKPAHVQRLVTEMEAKGLAPRTVRYGHGVLRNALNKAVREGTIPANPAAAKLVDLPRNRRRELTVFSPPEARAFVEAAQEDRWAALWLLLIGSGARPGEALGLTWPDYDGRAIRIQRTLVRDRRGGGWKLQEPKTSRSRRSVPLPDVAVDALRTHRRRQAEEKLAAGPDYTDHGLIFADDHGEPLVWSEVCRLHWKGLLTQADLPQIRPYDLRHSCASLLLAQGVNPKIVAERLGHSTITLTLDTYSAVLPGLQEEATERLGAMLGGERIHGGAP